MEDEEIPFEDIYSEEEDLNVTGVLYREADKSWSPTKDIDWGQEIDLPDEKKKSLADAATQFHYSNASHLIICGRLLEKAEDMATKKLAVFLAFSKMRNVDVFGRYIGRVSVDTEIAPQTKEYLSRMSSEEDEASLLLGMGVLGGTVGYGVLEFLGDAGDPLFSDIAERVGQQKKDNQKHIVSHLSDIISSLDEEEIDRIEEQAAFYRDRSEKIVLYHTELLETLEIDPEEVVDYVLELTDEFYKDIGLDLEKTSGG